MTAPAPPSRAALRQAARALALLDAGRQPGRVYVPPFAGPAPVDPDEPEVSAVVALAGEVAEKAMYDDVDPPHLADSRAEVAAAERVAAGDSAEGRGEFLGEAVMAAVRLVGARWDRVLALAAALDERKTLTGAEVEELLRG